jgi:Zn-dependent peptidase ImmA (M78 family)
VSADPEEVAQSLRQALGVSIEDQIGWKSAGEALRRWRAAIETQYAFVFQFGMPVREILGFSLVEHDRPVIVLNSADYIITRRVFTLFHELAHLLAAQPGVCVPEEGMNGAWHRVETFCNRFANAFLVPRADLKANLPDAPQDAAIARLASRYRVSRYVVLSAMLALGAVSKETYERIVRRWQLPPKPSKHKGGLTPVQRCLAERGRRFVSVVLEAERREHIPAIDATTYLGVSLENLRELAVKVK